MNLLKEGDIVMVYDSNYGKALKGIVIQDEMEGTQVYVAIVSNGSVFQNYYDKYIITKVF